MFKTNVTLIPIEIGTDFDDTIGSNIISQDIGRLLLNLYNNAFYSVYEKKLSLSKSEKKKNQPTDYEPIITVSTRKLDNFQGRKGKIEIKIKDNGNGIPQNIIDKIFQPFFTTKPTGHGTGLGLSLAYDITT